MGREVREVQPGFSGPALLSALEGRTEMSLATGDFESNLGGGITVIDCPYTRVD